MTQETKQTLLWKRQPNGEHLAFAEGNVYKIFAQPGDKKETWECWFKFKDAPWSFIIYEDKLKYGKHYLQQLHDHPEDWQKHTGRDLPRLERHYRVDAFAHIKMNHYEEERVKAFVKSKECKDAVDTFFWELLERVKNEDSTST